jgi:hypothetical protein
VNTLRSTGILIVKKQKHTRRAHTEEKLDGIVSRLERTPRISLKRLAQETGVSKSSARRTTQLLNCIGALLGDNSVNVWMAQQEVRVTSHIPNQLVAARRSAVTSRNRGASISRQCVGRHT